MNYLIFFIISIVSILASIVIAVVISKSMSKKRQNGVIKPFYILLTGLFVSTFLLLMPVYYSICDNTPLRLLKTILFSIQGTFQAFTVDADTSFIMENITDSIGSIAEVYSAVLSVLYVIAPIFTFGVVVSFFKNALAYIKFFFKRRKDLYVFSELNEKSLALAEDIKKNHSKCAIVFTDIFDQNEEKSYELIGRANELGAICFKKDILFVKLKIHSPAKAMYLFLIGTDEAENIGQALKIIGAYGSVPNTYLYVFTTRTEGDLLLSHNHGMSMKVRRVNEIRSLINRMLYEKGTDLFDKAVPTVGDEKKIHAVIVGLGSHGKEMLKALTWYCQMDGYHIEIDAYDKDELAEERFTSLCPELMSKDYNGVVVPGEVEYTIRIHAGVDVETKSFADSISNMKDVTYAFVALGSDELNVRIAVNLRMLFERSRIKPVIHSVIWNSEEVTALENITNYRGQPYGIGCFGDIRSSFSENVIINSELEKEALQRHLKWGKEEEFWQYEYNYNSSMASAIHMRARIFCGISGADKPNDEWTKEEKAIIEPLEHRRWNAYMRAEGYVFSGSKDKSSRNDLAKMHHDLVDFSSLTEEEKRKDSRVGSR